MSENIVFHKKLGGFGPDSRYITYMTFWTKDWQVYAGMYFFPGEPSTVVDIGMDEKGLLTMFTYPHNDEPLCKTFAEACAESLYEFFNNAKPENLFTILLSKDGFRCVTIKDFTDHFPSSSVKNPLFIFDDETFGFPIIYCVAEVQRSAPHNKLLQIFAQASHKASMTSGSQTIFGKRLFYILSNSLAQKNFDKTVPTVDAMVFPTSSRVAVPKYLKTTKLQELLKKCGADKFLVQKDGKIVAPVSTETKSEESELDDENDDDLPLSTAIQPYIPSSDLTDKIIKDIMDRAMINMSDLFNYGIAETLKMIGKTDMIVEVNPDLPSIAAKMCIFQGQVHCVPLLKPEELYDFLDTDEVEMVIHTTDTFPRNLK
jgi:hypothetical protein